jgi:glyoxylase-like metal-dependent hydrolase (beta-lactamase superfamily II)
VRQQQLKRISEHVYLLEPEASTDRPSLGVVTGKRSTLIIDAGNSPDHVNLLLNQMAYGNLAPPTYVVLTHWHWDHVFGSSAFDVPIFAHEETARKVKEMSQLDWSDEALDQRVETGTEIEFCRDMIRAEWPDRRNLQLKLPDVSFKDRLEFDLGDIHCQVEHIGGDHAPDSVIVYLPEEKVMFLGDALYEDLHHGAPSYTVHKLYPLLDNILRYQADLYIWSHESEPMPEKEMMEFVKLLKKIGNLVQQVGPNREILLLKLRDILGQDLSDEQRNIAESFLNGLHTSS